MSSLSDLRDALYETLQSRGCLDEIRAKIRAEILSSLDAPEASRKANLPPEVQNANLLINELFRDYLQYNGYHNTLAVFLPESGTAESFSPSGPGSSASATSTGLSREFLSSQLHLHHNEYSLQIPLLYSILAILQQGEIGKIMKNAVELEKEMEEKKNENSANLREGVFGKYGKSQELPVEYSRTDNNKGASGSAGFFSTTKTPGQSAQPMAFSQTAKPTKPESESNQRFSHPYSSSSSNSTNPRPSSNATAAQRLGLSGGNSFSTPSSFSSSKNVTFHSPVAEFESIPNRADQLSASQDSSLERSYEEESFDQDEDEQ